jgi:ribonuclease P protein component
MAAPCCRAAALGAAINCRSATKELSGTPIKSGPGGKQSFPSSSRILRSADFRTVYDNGTRVSGPLFAAFCLRRSEGDGAGVRIGLTVPKALGGAVVRNRIKRRLRSAFRLHRADWNIDWDIVLNPRKAAILAPFADLERALAEVIRKCPHL